MTERIVTAAEMRSHRGRCRQERCHMAWTDGNRGCAASRSYSRLAGGGYRAARAGSRGARQQWRRWLSWLPGTWYSKVGKCAACSGCATARTTKGCGLLLLEQNVSMLDLAPGDWEPTLENALQWSSVVLDGLLGTGLKRDIEGDLAELVRTVAASGKKIIAIDIPTGIDSDTGAIRGAALRADMTVTFGYSKYGHYLHPGKDLRGDIKSGGHRIGRK